MAETAAWCSVPLVQPHDYNCGHNFSSGIMNVTSVDTGGGSIEAALAAEASQEAASAAAEEAPGNIHERAIKSIY